MVLYHIDLYRLDSTEEAINIGIEEYINSGYPCYIEWPEIIEHLNDVPFVVINISQIGENQRLMHIENI